jgi:hypothetical protein
VSPDDDPETELEDALLLAPGFALEDDQAELDRLDLDQEI